jgi:hypothetical protein
MTMGADKDERRYRAGSGAMPAAPKSVHVQKPRPLTAAREDAANTATPVVAVASAQGLEPKGRASLEQHLAKLTVPAGQPAELTLTLTVVRGHVDQVTVVKTAGAADAATVKAIVTALEAWKAPVWVDGKVQLVLEVR